MSVASDWVLDFDEPESNGDGNADGKAMDAEEIEEDAMAMDDAEDRPRRTWHVADPASVPDGLRGCVLRCRLAVQAAERMGEELRQSFRRPDLRPCVCRRCVPVEGVVALDDAGSRVWFFDTEMKSKEPPDVTPTISEIAFINAVATDVFHRFVFYKRLHKSYKTVVKYVKEQTGGKLDLEISPWDSRATSDLFPNVVWLMIARIPCQSLLISNGHDFDPVVLYENIKTRCNEATATFLMNEIRGKQWKWVSLEEITGNFFPAVYFGGKQPPSWMIGHMFPHQKALFKQVDREFKAERFFILLGDRLRKLQATMDARHQERRDASRQSRRQDTDALAAEARRCTRVLDATQSPHIVELMRDLKPLVASYVQQFCLYRPPDGFEEVSRPVSIHLPAWSPVVIGKPRPVRPLADEMDQAAATVSSASTEAPRRPEMVAPVARLQHLAHPLEGYSAQCGVNIAYHSATVDALCKMQVVAAILLQIEVLASLDASMAKRVHAFFRERDEEDDADVCILPAWMKLVFRDVLAEETRSLASGLLKLTDTGAMLLYATYYKDAVVLPGEWKRGRALRLLDEVEAEIQRRAKDAVAAAARQRPTGAGGSGPSGRPPKRSAATAADERIKRSVRADEAPEDDFSLFEAEDEKKRDEPAGAPTDEVAPQEAPVEAVASEQMRAGDEKKTEEEEATDNTPGDLLQIMQNAPVQLEYMDYEGYAQRIRDEAKSPADVVALYKEIFAQRTAREREYTQRMESAKNGFSRVAPRFISPLPDGCDTMPYFIGAYGRGRSQDMDWTGAVRVHFVWCLHFYGTVDPRKKRVARATHRTDADDAVDAEESVAFQERTRIAYASNVDDHRAPLPKVPRPNLRWLALLDAAKLSCSYVFCKNCKWYEGDGARSISLVMQAWLPDLPVDNTPETRKKEASLSVRPVDLEAMDVYSEPQAPNLPYHYGRPVHPYEIDALDETIRRALQRKRINKENLTIARLKPDVHEYSVGRWCLALLLHHA